MKAILLLIFMVLSTTLVKGQESLKVVTVHLKSKKQLRFIQKQSFDVAGIEILKDKSALVDIVVNRQEKWRLESLGFRTQIAPYRQAKRIDENFKTPDEIEAILKDFHSRFPHISKMVLIGKSLEGRNIWAMRITDNPQKNERGEHSVLFNSMHHAREVMSPEVSLDIIEYLLTHYNKSQKVNFWVNNLDIWVVPMLNVDGNTKVWEGHGLWRKNTRDGHGVDLNRNYPFQWGHCNGSSGHKYSDTYRGPSPASEPETRVLMNLVGNIRPVFDISYHTYSQLVIFPMGCQGDRVKDRKLIEGIGYKLGELLNYTAGYGWDLLYSADGGDTDWMYDRWGVISYVLELNSRSVGFHPPYSLRQSTVERNRIGWQYLLDRMFRGGIDFDIKGKHPSEDVYVNVFRAEDGKALEDYELKTDGTLRIMLTPGVYKVVLEARSKKTTWKVEIADKLVPLKFQL